MSDPFRIELANALLECGQQLNGTVHFDQAFPQLQKANGVRLEVFVTASGSGTSDTVKIADERIHIGPVEAPTRVGFSVTIPLDGPCSYEGRYVKLLWKVKVSVDVDWAIDPKQTVDFKVVPKSASAAQARAG